MKYKIAVCDDNTIDREYVISFINRWAEEKQKNIEIRTYSSAEQFLFQYAEEKDYDILVLDIEMGKLDGVSLAKQIRLQNDRIQIVFVTGFPDYMSEGYEVDAVHYLLKPVENNKLWSVLEKAIRNLGRKEEVIYFQTNNEMTKVVLKDICFVEVLAHSCTIHTMEGEFETKITMCELEKKLGQRFIRTHRSFLVNIEKIKRIMKTDVVLDDDTKVPLSRRSYAQVARAFMKHFGEKWENV